MEHFDESEVQEIGLDDTNYPNLLRAIRKPPKILRFRGSLPLNREIIQKRPHSALGSLTPIDFEQKNLSELC